MTKYALINLTTKNAQGWETLEEALEAAKTVGPAENWIVVHMPAQMGAGRVVADGRGPLRD